LPWVEWVKLFPPLRSLPLAEGGSIGSSPSSSIAGHPPPRRRLTSNNRRRCPPLGTGIIHIHQLLPNTS